VGNRRKGRASPSGPAPSGAEPDVSLVLDEDAVSAKWGVLTGIEIRELSLIQNPNWETCLRGASYDLRLGDEALNCQAQTPEIKPVGVSLEIKPMESVIFSTFEHVCLPDGIVGRFDLKMVHVLSGLIFQVGPQVRPGYDGPLFGLITNTSGLTRRIGRHSRFATIEFSRTSGSTRPLFKPEKIADLNEFLELHDELVGNLVAPSVLHDLRVDLDGVKEQLRECKVSHGFKTDADTLAETKKSNDLTAAMLRITKRGVLPVAIISVLISLALIPSCRTWVSDLASRMGSPAIDRRGSEDASGGLKAASPKGSSTPTLPTAGPDSQEASDGVQR